MPGNVVQARAVGEDAFHVVRDVAFEHGVRASRQGGAEQPMLELGQPPGIPVGAASDHDAIGPRERVEGALGIPDSAVEHHRESGKLALEAAHAPVLERRDGAVLGGAQAGQGGDPGMHGERGDPRVCAGADEVPQERIVVVAVHAQPALHRDGQGAGIAHGRQAGRHAPGLEHQAGPEGAALHAR